MSLADAEELGLGLMLHHPTDEEAARLSAIRDEDDTVLYPELDADGDHVHFEIVPMKGRSRLWITIHRETAPALAAQSLRKIADLIERRGKELFNYCQGDNGSFSSDGLPVDGPKRLAYDENGDLVIPACA